MEQRRDYECAAGYSKQNTTWTPVGSGDAGSIAKPKWGLPERKPLKTLGNQSARPAGLEPATF